jgi:ribosomal protein S18 acetylase RimI-like enzyme
MENIIELNDSKIITEIINNAFITVAKQYNFSKENAPRFPAFIDSNIIDENIKNGLKMYGYRKNDQIIGCAGYKYYKDQIYFIERLATLPENRHLGIGRKLMEYLENIIKNNGGKTVEIHVVDKNIVLIEWYKKLNYKYVRVDEIKSLPFNSYVMNKELI